MDEQQTTEKDTRSGQSGQPTADLRDDDRPDPPQAAIDIAIQMSTFSPCQSKRGSTIFATRGGGVHILGRGYNHKSKFACDGSSACKVTCRFDAIHAEQMALINAAKTGFIVGMEALHVKTINGALVPSGGPSCVECSKLMLASGVAAVWLYHADGWRWYEMGEFHALSIAAKLADGNQPATQSSGNNRGSEAPSPSSSHPGSLTDQARAKAVEGANGGVLLPEEEAYLLIGVGLALELVEQEARKRAEQGFNTPGYRSACNDLAYFCRQQREGTNA